MEKEIYTGKFIANVKGFGFVEVEDLETDIFIGEENIHRFFQYFRPSFRLCRHNRPLR